MILFETARLIIWMWKQTDLAAFQALNADQTVMEYFPKVLSAAETNDFYINIQTNFKTNGASCKWSATNQLRKELIF